MARTVLVFQQTNTTEDDKSSAELYFQINVIQIQIHTPLMTGYILFSGDDRL